MKTISSKQFYVFVFFITVVSKFLYLPSVLSTYSNKNAFIVAFIWFLIDALFLLGVLYFIKNSQHSFFTSLQKNTFKPIQKILLLFYTLYFFLKTTLFILESTELFQVAFYSSFSHYEFFILLAFFILYAFTLSTRTLARSLELLKPFFLLGLLFVFFVALTNANMLNSLPILQNGLGEIINDLLKSIIWFGDFFILFLFMNKVKVTKHFYKEAMLHYIFASGLVIIFVFCFYSTFALSSLQKTLAIYDLLQNMNGNSIFTKLDWLFLSFWTLGLLFQTLLYSYATFAFLKQLLPKINAKLNAVLYIILLFFMLYFYEFQTLALIQLLQKGAVVFGILQYVIPALLFLLFLNNKFGGAYAKNKMEKS